MIFFSMIEREPLNTLTAIHGNKKNIATRFKNKSHKKNKNKIFKKKNESRNKKTTTAIIKHEEYDIHKRINLFIFAFIEPGNSELQNRVMPANI